MHDLMVHLFHAAVTLTIGGWLAAHHGKVVDALVASGDASNAVFGHRQTEAQRRASRIVGRIIITVLTIAFLGGGVLELGRALVTR